VRFWQSNRQKTSGNIEIEALFNRIMEMEETAKKNEFLITIHSLCA
jgi:hypothetical protein